MIKQFNENFDRADKAIQDLNYVLDSFLFAFGDTPMTARATTAVTALRSSVQAMRDLVYQDVQTQLAHNKSLSDGLTKIAEKRLNHQP